MTFRTNKHYQVFNNIYINHCVTVCRGSISITLIKVSFFLNKRPINVEHNHNHLAAVDKDQDTK
jgi:hypothetical protein